MNEWALVVFPWICKSASFLRSYITSWINSIIKFIQHSFTIHSLNIHFSSSARGLLYLTKVMARVVQVLQKLCSSNKTIFIIQKTRILSFKKVYRRVYSIPFFWISKTNMAELGAVANFLNGGAAGAVVEVVTVTVLTGAK